MVNSPLDHQFYQQKQFGHCDGGCLVIASPYCNSSKAISSLETVMLYSFDIKIISSAKTVKWFNQYKCCLCYSDNDSLSQNIILEKILKV